MSRTALERHIIVDSSTPSSSSSTSSSAPSAAAAAAATPSSSTTSSSSRTHTTDAFSSRAVPRRAVQCPPLVVAPAHGTLQLLPARLHHLQQQHHSPAPPTSEPESRSSSGSLRSSAEMISSNASLDGRHRPLPITSDPRVYRGSVFANRRLANDRARQAEQVESKEKRYRVGVIRDQLNTLLPRVPPSASPSAVSSKIHKVSSKTRTASFLPEILNGSAVSASIDKRGTAKSFATARFMPLRSQTKVGNGDVFGKPPLPAAPIVKEAAQFPVKVVVNFERNQPPEATSSIRRHSRHVALSQTATPPSSSRPVYPIVDTGVQTDDNFDQKFEGLVKELANSAIEMAMINLEAENTLRAVRQEAEAAEHELRAVTRKQNIESADWRRQLREKNHELATWKKQEADAREAQKLAQATCQEVTRKTMENLKIIEKNSRRSIGLDTRDMVQLEQKMALVTAELEKDFFPWIFNRAERMFKHRIARRELDHSMLNEKQHRREQAKKRLINMDLHAL